MHDCQLKVFFFLFLQRAKHIFSEHDVIVETSKDLGVEKRQNSQRKIEEYSKEKIGQIRPKM